MREPPGEHAGAFCAEESPRALPFLQPPFQKGHMLLHATCPCTWWSIRVWNARMQGASRAGVTVQVCLESPHTRPAPLLYFMACVSSWLSGLSPQPRPTAPLTIISLLQEADDNEPQRLLPTGVCAPGSWAGWALGPPRQVSWDVTRAPRLSATLLLLRRFYPLSPGR